MNILKEKVDFKYTRVCLKRTFVTAGFIPAFQFSCVFATLKVAVTNFPQENRLLRQPLYFIFCLIAFYNSTTLSFDSTYTHHNTIWQDIGNDFMTGLNDASAYITLPLHTSAKQWFFTAGIIDALVISSTTDATLKEKVNSKSNNDYNHNFWDIPTYYGETITAGIISGGVYLTGLFSRNNSIRTTGRMLIESVIFAGVIDLGLKYVTGRDRPYFNNSQYFFKAFQTKDEHVSFPSGHATIAFAMSTVLAERIDNTYARIGLYGFAGLDACARIINNRHWLSDVLAGGVLGFGTGWFVVHRSPTHACGVASCPPQRGGNDSSPSQPPRRGGEDSGFFIYPSLNGLNLVWKW